MDFFSDLFYKWAHKAGIRFSKNIKPHVKALMSPYPGSEQQRFEVPESKISWSVIYNEYAPFEYTSNHVSAGPAWADPEIRKSKNTTPLKFNAVDGSINRKSFTGYYDIVNGIPQNPCGRTGLIGRGLLGKWGPNHAADPIVTRWKRDEQNDIVKHNKSGKKLLQFVSIMRKDNHEWAIPGGMVDANETVSETLKREFGEETVNSLKMTSEQKENLEKQISQIFSGGFEIYKGYVDDPRNTDNAWMETVAMNFHDETGTSVGSLPLHAGDDAGAVCWKDISCDLVLYASHAEFLKRVAERLDAHW